MKSNNLSGKFLLYSLWLELILLCVSFYIFSSKLFFFPWYFRLSTYTLLYVLILLVLQFVIFIYSWSMYERQSIFKSLRRICLLHLLMLMVMFMSCILSVDWFNFSAILSSAMVCILIVYTIKTYICK